MSELVKLNKPLATQETTMIKLRNKIKEEGPQMRAKKLVQTIIGSAGFVLEDITVNPEMNEINIAVRPTEHERCR